MTIAPLLNSNSFSDIAGARRTGSQGTRYLRKKEDNHARACHPQVGLGIQFPCTGSASLDLHIAVPPLARKSIVCGSVATYASAD